MKIFQRPQDPFMEKEFVEMLSKFLKITYTNGIPTIKGKTFFWSDKKYQGIKKQYVIDAKAKRVSKHFFILAPQPYEETFRHYHGHFRNQVRKAQTYSLVSEKVGNMSEQLLKVCYKMYDENMKRLCTFSFEYDFFKSVCALSFTEIFLIKNKGEVISFAVMLGNLLFLQSSTPEGKKMCANNLLYDNVFKYFENNAVFTGTAAKNNPGLYRFKEQSGQTPYPAKATFIDFTHYIPGVLTQNKVTGMLIRKVNKKKMLPFVLPY